MIHGFVRAAAMDTPLFRSSAKHLNCCIERPMFRFMEEAILRKGSFARLGWITVGRIDIRQLHR